MYELETWHVDAAESRKELFGGFRDMVLEKNVDHMDVKSVKRRRCCKESAKEVPYWTLL